MVYTLTQCTHRVPKTISTHLAAHEKPRDTVPTIRRAKGMLATKDGICLPLLYIPPMLALPEYAAPHMFHPATCKTIAGYCCRLILKQNLGVTVRCRLIKYLSKYSELLHIYNLTQPIMILVTLNRLKYEICSHIANDLCRM